MKLGLVMSSERIYDYITMIILMAWLWLYSKNTCPQFSQINVKEYYICRHSKSRETILFIII